MDLGLTNRVAIVTGGNRGIGYAVSAELLRRARTSWSRASIRRATPRRSKR